MSAPLGVTSPRSWLARLSPLTADPKTRPELDGLRGLAVLLTVALHLALYLPRAATLDPSFERPLMALRPLFAFGATGVHLFFVLSGFLLFRPYAAAILEGRALPSTGRYLARRALRILPAYWVALTLIVVLLRPEFLEASRRQDLVLHAFLLHDWSEATIESINPPFWTMAIESQFYLLLPLLAWGLYRALRARGRALLVSFLLGVALLPLACVLARRALVGVSPSLAIHATALYPFGFLLVFAAGAAIAFVHVGYERRLLPPWLLHAFPRYARIGGVLGVFALALQAAVNVAHPGTMDEHGAAYWLWSVPLFAFGYGGLLLGTLHGFASWGSVLSRRELRFVGAISYSLYIWNVPLLAHVVIPAAARGGGDVWIVARALVGVLLVLIPVSYLSFMLIERPAFAVRLRLR